MPPIYFKAPLDNSVIITTTIFSVLLLGLAVFTLFAARGPELWVKIMIYMISGIMVATVIVSYLLAPTGYKINSEILTIVRPIKSIQIPLGTISNAELVSDPALLSNSIRLFGCGGLWGYYGKFQNSKLGTYLLYVRKNSGQIVIRGQTTYVIAPDRPAEFMQYLNKLISARSLSDIRFIAEQDKS